MRGEAILKVIAMKLPTLLQEIYTRAGSFTSENIIILCSKSLRNEHF